MKPFLALVLSVVALLLAAPATAFDVVDGKVTITLPAEKEVMDACMAGSGGCFIVNQEIMAKYAEFVAAQARAELMAEVREQFEAAVAARAKEDAKAICKNAI